MKKKIKGIAILGVVVVIAITLIGLLVNYGSKELIKEGEEGFLSGTTEIGEVELEGSLTGMVKVCLNMKVNKQYGNQLPDLDKVCLLQGEVDNETWSLFTGPYLMQGMVPRVIVEGTLYHHDCKEMITKGEVAQCYRGYSLRTKSIEEGYKIT